MAEICHHTFITINMYDIICRFFKSVNLHDKPLLSELYFQAKKRKEKETRVRINLENLEKDIYTQIHVHYTYIIFIKSSFPYTCISYSKYSKKENL